MAEFESSSCPECREAFDYPAPPPIGRRAFLAGAAALAASPLLAAPAAAKKPKPAEELARELFSTLKDDQKKKVALPYDAANTKGDPTPKGGIPLRLHMVNEALGKVTLDSVYTKAQMELVERIVKALSSGEDGYRQISRGGTWDASKTFGKTGAHFFGDPMGKEKWAFTFTGHHLTIRCDGDFSDGVAFGGPIYYGHTPYGYAPANIFSYQTKAVLSVFDALDGKQQAKAVVIGSPGEGAGSVKLRKKAEERPGILYADLSKDQQGLVAKVMREVLSPFRQEDGDETMEAIKRSGGMEKIHLAFYADKEAKPDAKKKRERWSFWRLEGPGFVWNYRVLDHVHTYVNIDASLRG
ncbi:MAG: DUF3500 domain-containing protein [Gemmataceae bacterium]|nr:DUF3500 domain-containing protein [Gemmataceae bacterium]